MTVSNLPDDPIDRLRAHVKKHKHHEQAFFSTAGLTMLLDLLDTQARQFREFVERDADDAIELRRQRDELKSQVERLLSKESKYIEDVLGDRRVGVSVPLRKDANGNEIPWAKEHDYFMAFDPDNPDMPTD